MIKKLPEEIFDYSKMSEKKQKKVRTNIKRTVSESKEYLRKKVPMLKTCMVVLVAIMLYALVVSKPMAKFIASIFRKISFIAVPFSDFAPKLFEPSLPFAVASTVLVAMLKVFGLNAKDDVIGVATLFKKIATTTLLISITSALSCTFAESSFTPITKQISTLLSPSVATFEVIIVTTFTVAVAVSVAYMWLETKNLCLEIRVWAKKKRSKRRPK